MRVVGTFEDRAEWLAARRQGVGASDIAAIVGLSPWSTPWQVYVDKIGAGPLDDNDERTESMRWGQLLESLVLDEWERESGLYARYRGVLAGHSERPWALCSLDALAYEYAVDDYWLSHMDTAVADHAGQHIADDAIAVIEAKTTSDFMWSEIPIHYRAQAQWQMAVTGLDAAIFAVLHNGRALRVYDLAADYDDQNALLEAGERFWTEHVLAGVPPAVTGDDNSALAFVWPNDDGAYAEVDGDLVDRLIRVRANEKQMTAQRDELEARIKDQLKEAAIGLVDGAKAVSWKTQTAHRIDTKALRAEMPEVADQFTNETQSRGFRLHQKEQ